LCKHKYFSQYGPKEKVGGQRLIKWGGGGELTPVRICVHDTRLRGGKWEPAYLRRFRIRLRGKKEGGERKSAIREKGLSLKKNWLGDPIIRGPNKTEIQEDEKED